ncbi:MAG TPA: S1 family peptidase, partial [Polyangiaceae bacterium]|nr:S1 family peptidase [Polyangiaceae bacterium]
MRSRLRSCLLVAFAGAACSSYEPDFELVAQRFDPIINGTLDTSTSNDSIVMVFHQGPYYQSICTGTLIAPNIVLTARHCVSNTNEYVDCVNDVTGEFSASELYILKGYDPLSGNPQAIAQGAQVYHDGSKGLCGHDLALIRLSSPISSLTPVRVRVSSAPTIGETFKAVGYGLTNPNNPNSSGRRYYRDGVTVSQIVYGNDFRGGQSICSGDSGGPAISQQGAVFGVTSRGADCYGNDNYWTRTDSFKSLIDQAATAAGTTYTGEDGTIYPGGGGSGGSG